MFSVSSVFGKEGQGIDEKEAFDASLSSKMDKLYNKFISNEEKESKIRFLGSNGIKTPNKMINVEKDEGNINYLSTPYASQSALKAIKEDERLSGAGLVDRMSGMNIEIYPAKTETGAYSGSGESSGYLRYLDTTKLNTSLGGYIANDPRLPNYRNIGSSPASLGGPLSLGGMMTAKQNVFPSDINSRFNVRPFDKKKPIYGMPIPPMETMANEAEGGCCCGGADVEQDLEYAEEAQQEAMAQGDETEGSDLVGEGKEEDLSNLLNTLPDEIVEKILKQTLPNNESLSKNVRSWFIGIQNDVKYLMRELKDDPMKLARINWRFNMIPTMLNKLYQLIQEQEGPIKNFLDVQFQRIMKALISALEDHASKNDNENGSNKKSIEELKKLLTKDFDYKGGQKKG